MPPPAVIHCMSPAPMVPVLDPSLEHVRHGLDATVRVPREPHEIVARVVGPEVVQEQERVQHRHLARPERAPQVHARALERRLAGEDVLDRPLLGHA